MGVVRNAANTKIRGRVGQTTYYVSGQQQIARQALNNSNYGETARRSEAQQNRRVLWANLVNFYKVSAGWMPKAFETKKPNQSDYNKFMQVNVSMAKVALKKDEVTAGACVVSDYIVSQGSLPSIEIAWLTNRWRTNLALGTLEIGATTTNAELTAALEDNNANVRAGMQLSFVSYQQSVDALGTPRAICRCYEITLSRTDASLVRDHLPDFCSQTVEGNIGTNTNVSIGGFAYILSELQGGVLRVSTQQLVTNNAILIDRYTSATQIADAISSYGVDREVILSPLGSVTQTPEAQPVFIQTAVLKNVTYNAGSYVGPVNNLASASAQLVMSAGLLDTPTSIRAYDSNDTSYTLTDITSVGNIINARFPENITSSNVLKRIRVTAATGEVYMINFATPQSGGGELN